jgi:hypothetical protein
MLRRSAAASSAATTPPVADADFARGRLDEAGDQPERRGLAAAGRSEQADQRAVRDRHRRLSTTAWGPYFFVNPRSSTDATGNPSISRSSQTGTPGPAQMPCVRSP